VTFASLSSPTWVDSLRVEVIGNDEPPCREADEGEASRWVGRTDIAVI
jgi:hypothetical protein